MKYCMLMILSVFFALKGFAEDVVRLKCEATVSIEEEGVLLKGDYQIFEKEDGSLYANYMMVGPSGENAPYEKSQHIVIRRLKDDELRKAKSDESVTYLAELAKVELAKVVNIDIYVIEPSDDGSVATIFDFKTEQKSLGKAGTFGWFPGYCAE